MSTGMSMSFRTDGITIHDDDSPDLMEVAVKIKQLRDSGSQASKAHSRDITEIQNDQQLSDQGRAERISELKAAHASQRRTSINAENEIIDNKIATLERRLDGFVGYSSSDIIAYRDAQDRAEAVKDEGRAAKLMDRALRSNDRTLAHALFRAAVDNNWVEAQRSFAKENSSIAAIVNDVQKLRALRNTFGRGLNYM
ncbi:hypothetical protein ACR5KS_02960 [Leucobacter sp. W1153]|uniref:hypothetical protein n=1 Tax=Leucobacter sp. W1153 TaxID=3439064 RepID=UPI003F3B4ED0